MSGAIMDVTSVCWNTPPELVSVVTRILGGAIDLDPCGNPFSMVEAKHWFSLDEGVDGLAQPWAMYDRIYVNPPWGRGIDKWMERAFIASCAGSNVIMLVPAAVETKAWAHWVWPYAQRVCFLHGRVKFWLNGKPAEASCTRPAALALFSKDPAVKRRFDVEGWRLGEVMILEGRRALAA